MTRKVLLVAAAAVLLVLTRSPSRLHACGCINPGFEMLSPGAGQPAPTNTRVRVTFVASWANPVEILVRSGGEVVATTATTLASGKVRIVELTPSRELAARTGYEVVATERGPGGSETVVGVFTTGDRADVVAPSWVAKPRASYFVGASPCSSQAGYARVTAAPASDDVTASDAILYAVWVAAAGRVDVDAPPLTYLPLVAGAIVLGSADGCDLHQFVIPRRGRGEIAVAAVDAAGNRSAPVVVALRRGIHRRSR